MKSILQKLIQLYTWLWRITVVSDRKKISQSYYFLWYVSQYILTTAKKAERKSNECYTIDKTKLNIPRQYI